MELFVIGRLVSLSSKGGLYFFYIFLILLFTKQLCFKHKVFIFLRYYMYTVLLESDTYCLCSHSKEPSTQFNCCMRSSCLNLCPSDQSIWLIPSISKHPRMSRSRYYKTSVLIKSINILISLISYKYLCLPKVHGGLLYVSLSTIWKRLKIYTWP